MTLRGCRTKMAARCEGDKMAAPEGFPYKMAAPIEFSVQNGGAGVFTVQKGNLEKKNGL